MRISSSRGDIERFYNRMILRDKRVAQKIKPIDRGTKVSPPKFFPPSMMWPVWRDGIAQQFPGHCPLAYELSYDAIRIMSDKEVIRSNILFIKQKYHAHITAGLKASDFNPLSLLEERAGKMKVNDDVRSEPFSLFPSLDPLPAEESNSLSPSDMEELFGDQTDNSIPLLSEIPPPPPPSAELFPGSASQEEVYTGTSGSTGFIGRIRSIPYTDLIAGYLSGERPVELTDEEYGESLAKLLFYKSVVASNDTLNILFSDDLTNTEKSKPLIGVHDVVAAWVSLYYSLSTAESWTVRYAHINTFLVAMTQQGIIEHLVKIQPRIVEMITSLCTSCKNWGFMLNSHGTTGDIQDSQLVKDAFKLCSCIFYIVTSEKFGIFSPETLQSIENMKLAITSANFIVVLSSFCLSLWRGVSTYLTTGDWQDIFFVDRLTGWYIETSDFCTEVLVTPRFRAAKEIEDDFASRILYAKTMIARYTVDAKVFAVVDRHLKLLTTTRLEWRNLVVSGEPRVPALGIQMVGGSGVGKSDLCMNLASQCQHSFGVNVGVEYLCMQSPADKFNSTYTGKQNGLIGDDWGAKNLQYGEEFGLQQIFELINPMPAYALSPIAEFKGRLLFNLSFVLVTSNTEDMGFSTMLTYPCAALRRLQLLIRVSIRTAYQGNSTLPGSDGPLKSPDVWNRVGTPAVAQRYQIYYRSSSGGSSAQSIVKTPVDPELWDISEDSDKFCSRPVLLRIINSYIKQYAQHETLARDSTLEYFNTTACQCGCIGDHSCAIATSSLTQDFYYLLLPYWIMVCYLLLSFKFCIMAKCRRLVSDGVQLTADAIVEDSIRVLRNYQADLVRSICVRARQVVPISVGIGGLIAVLSLVRRYVVEQPLATVLVKTPLGEKNIELEGAAPNSYPISHMKRPPIERVKPAFTSPSAIIPAAYFLEQIKDQIVTISDGKASFAGLVIESTYILTCYHGFKNTPAETLFTVSGNFSSNAFTMTKDFNYCVVAPDLVLLFVQSMRPGRKLTKYLSYFAGSSPPLYPVTIITRAKEKLIVEESSVPRVDSPFYYNCQSGQFPCSITCESKNIQPGWSGGVVVQLLPTPRIIGIVVCRTSARAGFVTFPDLLRSVMDERTFMPLSKFSIPSSDDFETIEVHEHGPHSIAPHLASTTVTYVGTVSSTGTGNGSSSQIPSPAYHLLSRNGRVTLGGEEKHYVLPQLSPRVLETSSGEYVYIHPQLVSMAEMGSRKVDIPLDVVDEAFEMYWDQVKSVPPAHLSSLSLRDVVSGDSMVSPLNVHTSAGYGFPGMKLDYVYPCEIDGNKTYRLKPEVAREYLEYVHSVANGPIPQNIVTAHIKDEILSASKSDIGRERIFYCTALFPLLLIRQFISPLLAYIHCYPFVFETMVGINAMSGSWSELNAFLSTFDHIGDGDWKFYDKWLFRILSHYFQVFMLRIANKCGYSEFEKFMVVRCCYLLTFFLVSVYGDLFATVGGEPSGGGVTVDANSFKTSILIRVAWLMLGHPARLFRQCVRLVTYGDDHVWSTSNSMFHFNAIRRFFLSLDVTYTSSSKSKVSPDFIPLSSVRFLKRGFLRLGEDVLCPLEEFSLFKMLMFTRISDPITVFFGNVFDAHRQYFFFGEKEFKTKRAFLQCLCYKLDMPYTVELTVPNYGVGKFSSWETMLEKYHLAQIQVNFA